MSNWIFPSDAPADPRRDLPVFTLTPNWRNGITERLEWLTDILVSERAVEMRRSLRRFPRRTFEANFLRTDSHRSRLDFFRTGVGQGEALVPLWHEQYRLDETGTSTGVVPFHTGTLAMREFRLNDLVLISTGDPDTACVLTVTAVDLGADTITLASDGPIGSWPAGARITPLRKARVMDQAALTSITDRAGTITMRFELVDSETGFTPDWGWYAPLWRFKPDRATELRTDYFRQSYVLDNSVGPITVTEPGDRAQLSLSMSLKFFGRKELFAYRRFLCAARGRAVRFWVPTGNSDLTPAQDISGSTLVTKVSGFFDYMAGPQDARKVIRISLKDGLPPHYRTITAVAPVLSTSAPFRPEAEQFTLDRPLPPIPLDMVERISFVVPSRFDQDGFEIFHPVDDSAAASAQVVTRSSTLAGMPPLDWWVTSKPYPVVSTEAVAPSMVITGGHMYEPNIPLTEGVDPTMSIGGGTLREIVRMLEPFGDSFDTSMALTGGTLQDILRSYDNGAEAISVAASLSDGTLQTILITYANYQVEALGLTATLSEGILE